MTYLIDAWLDRPHPYLRILHRDQGDLDVNGLSSSEPGVLKEVVRNLFLFCYARALRPATELSGKFHP
ncbi:MAG: hypothetical protein K0S85_3346 [Pseudomonas orientalis]|nr:hypothetical protein [Pseudomonas orientalis]